MNCGIMTFHFAHNYGAMLQAYALKNYIESIGTHATMVDFVPSKARKDYTLVPWAKDHHPRSILKRIMRIPVRINQYRKFESFQKAAFDCDEREYVLDSVVFGSDQIWSDDITGEIDDYYGGKFGREVEKIAYAASFGASSLSEFQRKCIRTYLPSFKAVSLREPDVVHEVESLSGRSVVSVVDPVFLLGKSDWHKFSEKAQGIHKDYILYYALRNDPVLIQRTEDASRNMGCQILCIHPTCADLGVGWKQLHDVGPYEFVQLVENAKLVATNSFHAVSFSVIFGKKVLYKAFSATESRVPSLLKLCCAESCIDGDGIYDFSFVDRRTLQAEIMKSKDFIRTALMR